MRIGTMQIMNANDLPASLATPFIRGGVDGRYMFHVPFFKFLKTNLK